MGKKIEFPGANEEQNKILNMIAEQKEKEAKAAQNAFDKEKDKEEFLYLWKHFDRRLKKTLEDFRDIQYTTGIHSLEVTIKVKKEGSTDSITEKFVYSDKLKMLKVTETD
ncbi:MAG: hypothetical protein PVG65_00885 [Candidatus Thorarchaeota archaeon]|jgi:hypothetical protein